MNKKVIISKKILNNNIEILKNEFKDTKIMGVLKSNAYGHGIIEMAEFLDDKVDMLGVSDCEEAKQINGKISKDIMILTPYFSEEIVDNKIIFTVDSIEKAEKLNKIAKVKGIIARMHLKVNTGLNRFGIDKDQISIFLDKVNKMQNVKLEGIFSHMAYNGVNNKKMALKQIDRFKEVKSYIEQISTDDYMYHLAASENAIDFEEARFDMVRIGNALYGPCQMKNVLPLKKIARCEIEVIDIVDRCKDNRIGYKGTCKLKEHSKVAILPFGFHDGYRVQKLNKAANIIELAKSGARLIRDSIMNSSQFYKDGIKLKQLGVENAQYTLIDVTNINIKIGDKITYKGPMFYINSNIDRVIEE
ncbi:MAG: alanine racemase [Clostridia bacterium]|jgi:alanine racemase|nr:alanine racemase [Clostridia bacterium]